MNLTFDQLMALLTALEKGGSVIVAALALFALLKMLDYLRGGSEDGETPKRSRRLKLRRPNDPKSD